MSDISERLNAHHLDYLRYQNGSLSADGVDLAAVIGQVGTPCYIYSRERTLTNFKRVRGAFPGAEIHYSLKANANLALVRMLVGAGAGMDAVSGGEVFRALKAGARPESIVFAGVGKTEAELIYALENHIGWINVESAGELYRVNELARKRNQIPRVALRVNPDVQADTHHYIATGHAAAKFGLPMNEARLCLNTFANKLAVPIPPTLDSVKIEGLHIHIGSQLHSVERTVEAIRAVLPLFDEYPFLTTLDLGGGFPVSYMGEAVPAVEDFAHAIHAVLGERTIHLLLEPGRYIIADAGLLAVEVQYIKASRNGVIIVTDGGMTELIRPALYGSVHDVLPIREPEQVTRLKSHIVGPVCESADVLRSDVMLPPLHPGDKLIILHAGAYGAVMGSTYNARPRPPEVLISGGSWQIARRRETWHDLIELEEMEDLDG